MLPLTEEQDYFCWTVTIAFLREKGWKNAHRENRWIFRAPSGSLHDLIAADIQQYERIEKEGLFLVN